MEAETEATRLAQLNRMRLIATGLLVLMALLLIASRLVRPAPGVWFATMQAVAAFAEAAVIGALADWFAVTALFRRPFGLPIPHTDVIASNKDRIGKSLGDFLDHNFMTREVIGAELARIDFADAIANWLARRDHSEALAGRITTMAPGLLDALDSRADLVGWLRRALTAAIRHVGIAPMLAGVGRILLAQERHQQLLDRLLGAATAALEEHRPILRDRFGKASPRWLPELVDDHYFNRIMQGLFDLLADAAHPQSVWRARIESHLEGWLAQLASTDQYTARLESLLTDLLEHPMFAAYAQDFIDRARASVLRDTATPQSQIKSRLASTLQAGAALLQHDADMRDQINAWMRALITDAVVGQRKTLSALVERVIARWDGPTVARKLELQVGRDLQYIRINGTLVGGLVGLALFFLGKAF